MENHGFKTLFFIGKQKAQTFPGLPPVNPLHCLMLKPGYKDSEPNGFERICQMPSSIIEFSYEKHGFKTMVFYREIIPVKNNGFETMFLL